MSQDPRIGARGGSSAGIGQAAEPEAEATRPYVVKQGDSLWSIAKRELGDAKLWPSIYALNKGRIGKSPAHDPKGLRAGQEILLPRAKAAAVKPAEVRPVELERGPATPTAPQAPLPQLELAPPKALHTIDLTSSVPAPGGGDTYRSSEDRKLEQVPARRVELPAVLTRQAVDAQPLLQAITARRGGDIRDLVRQASPEERAALLDAVAKAGRLGAMLKATSGKAHAELREAIAATALTPRTASAFVEHLLVGWTSGADQAAIVGALRQLPPDDLVATLGQLASAGRLEHLLGDVAGAARQELIEVVLTRADDPELVAAVVGSLVELRSSSTEPVLERALQRAESEPVMGTVIAAALLSRAAARGTEGEGPDGMREREREARARNVILTALASPKGAAALQAATTADLGAAVVGVARDAGRAELLVTLARSDATRHLAGGSNGEVYIMVAEQLLARGPAPALQQLLVELPPEGLPYLVARLGLQAATDLTAKIGKDEALGELRHRLDGERTLELARKPQLLAAERERLADDPARLPAERFKRELEQKLNAFEQTHGLRVELAVSSALLEEPQVRQQLRLAVASLEDAARQGLPLPPVVTLSRHNGLVLVRENDLWSDRLPVAEVRARLPMVRERLARVGVALEGELAAGVLGTDDAARRGALYLASYLERYHNILRARGISSVRLGGTTRLVEVGTAKKGAPAPRLLEVDARKLLAELGSQKLATRQQAEAKLSQLIGGAPSVAFIQGDTALRMTPGTASGGTVESSVAVRPFVDRPLSFEAAYGAGGVRAGATHGIELGKAKGSVGAGAAADGGYVQTDVSALIFRDRDTEVVGGFFGRGGWLANAGVTFFGEHLMRRPESQLDHDRIKAYVSSQILGGLFHAGVQWDFRDRPNDTFYPFVRLDNHLLLGGGVGFDWTGSGDSPVEVAAGLGGVSVGVDKKWKLDILLPFVQPWRFPWIFFNQFEPVTRYRFSFDYLNGTAEVQELTAGGEARGTSNIPQAALKHLYLRMMATAGVDVRPEELRAHIHERGLGDRVAQAQWLARSEDPAVRAVAEQSLQALTARLGGELMIAEYLKFAGKRPAVGEDDVRAYFEQHKAAFTTVRTGVLMYGSRAEAEAAAAQLQREPARFDELRKAQQEAGAANRPEVEFALGQPVLPEGLARGVRDLTPGQVSGVVDLGGGNFAVLRLERARVPGSVEELAPELHQVIAGTLQAERDQEAFARLFSQYLDHNRPFVESAVHVHREKLLAQVDDYDWRGVRQALSRVPLADATLEAGKASVAARLTKTLTALRAAEGRFGELGPAFAALGAALPEADRHLAQDLVKDHAAWGGSLAKAAAELEAIAAELRAASDPETVVRLEDRRQDAVHGLQKTLDELTLGGSKLEELWYALYQKQPQLAVPLARQIEAAKSAPELLALVPTDRAKDAGLVQELEQVFAPKPLPLTGAAVGDVALMGDPGARGSRSGRTRVYTSEGAGKQPFAESELPPRRLDEFRARPSLDEVRRSVEKTLDTINNHGAPRTVAIQGGTLEVPENVVALLGSSFEAAVAQHPERVAALAEAVKGGDTRRALTLMVDLVPDPGLQRFLEVADGEVILELLQHTRTENLGYKLVGLASLLADAKELPARLQAAGADVERLGKGVPEVVKRTVNDLARLAEQVDFKEYEGDLGAHDMGSRFQVLERMMSQLKPPPGSGIGGSVEAAATSNLSLAELLLVVKTLGGATAPKGASVTGGLLARLDIPDTQASAAIAATLFADTLASQDGQAQLSMRTRRYGMIALEVAGLNAARDLVGVVDRQAPLLSEAANGLARKVAALGDGFSALSVPLGAQLGPAMRNFQLPPELSRIRAQLEQLKDLATGLRDDPAVRSAGGEALTTLLGSVPRQDNGSVDASRLDDWLRELPARLDGIIAQDPTLAARAPSLELAGLTADIRALPKLRLDNGPIAALSAELGAVLTSFKGAHDLVTGARGAIDEIDKLLAAAKPLTHLDGAAKEVTAHFGARSGTEQEIGFEKRFKLDSGLFLDVGAVVGATEFDKNPDPNLLSNLLKRDIPVRLHTMAFAGTAKLRVSVQGATQVHARMVGLRDELSRLQTQLSGMTGALVERGTEAHAAAQRLLGLTDAELQHLPVGEILKTTVEIGQSIGGVLSELEGRLRELDGTLRGLEHAEKELRAAVDQFSVKIENKVRIHAADGAAAYIKELYARLTKEWDALGGSRGSLQFGGYNILGSAPGREINLHLEGNSKGSDLVWSETEKNVYRDLYALEGYLRAQLVAGLESGNPTAFQLELRKLFGDTSEGSPLSLMVSMRQYFFHKRLWVSALAGSSDLRQRGLDSVGATVGADVGPVSVYIGASGGTHAISGVVGGRFTIDH